MLALKRYFQTNRVLKGEVMPVEALVSIITPAYNDEKFIGKTIESVLAQTYKNFEMIIVDDCSTDNTCAVVESYKDSRIKLLKNEMNSGPAVSRNRAIAESQGKYVAFLDGDDMWFPEKLEKQITFMEKNNYDFSYTNYCIVDEDDQSLGIHVTGPKYVNKQMIRAYNWIGCLTVIYNAEKVGLVQIADIRKRNDWALWLKVVESANCHLLPEELSQYRKRISSVSHNNRLKMTTYHYKIYREHLNYGFIGSHIMFVINMICHIIKNKLFNKHFD